MKCSELYFAPALFSCFEGDGEAEKAAAAKAADEVAAATASAAAAAAAAGKTSFTQDDLNKILAEDRRKHQSQLKTMETKLQEVLTSKNLNENERKALQENLAAVQGQLRSKEAQAALEKEELKQSYETRLTESEKKAQGWESLYRESTLDRSLQDAAVKNDAFSPSQIVTLLRPMTALIEEMDPATNKSTGRYKPMVTMPDVDPKTGLSTAMVRTPEEAVKRMKELPDQYGNLFKAGVVSGIGAGSATGGLASGGGKIDVRKLTPQQYREIRAKNPELLGLRPYKASR
jgi:hypothetical protein